MLRWESSSHLDQLMMASQALVPQDGEHVQNQQHGIQVQQGGIQVPQGELLVWQGEVELAELDLKQEEVQWYSLIMMHHWVLALCEEMDKKASGTPTWLRFPVTMNVRSVFLWTPPKI